MNVLQRVVEDLKTVDGCLGAFVTEEDKCLASSLPAVVGAGRLQQVAGGFTKLAALAEKAGYPAPSFVVQGEKATLLAFATGARSFVTMVCGPGTERATAELFAGVAVDEVRAVLAAGTCGEIAIVSDTPPRTSRAHADKLRDQFQNRHGASLRELRELLVSHVGPIGTMLFERHLDAWFAEGPADWSRIHGLRTRLCAEVDDEQARAELYGAAFWYQ